MNAQADAVFRAASIADAAALFHQTTSIGPQSPGAGHHSRSSRGSAMRSHGARVPADAQVPHWASRRSCCRGIPSTDALTTGDRDIVHRRSILIVIGRRLFRVLPTPVRAAG
jgi:hypothetical protein